MFPPLEDALSPCAGPFLLEQGLFRLQVQVQIYAIQAQVGAPGLLQWSVRLVISAQVMISALRWAPHSMGGLLKKKEREGHLGVRGLSV